MPWHHFLITVPEGAAASDITIYIDGKNDGSSTTSGDISSPLTSSGDMVQIGKNTSNQFFSGSLDEIRIWSRTLSELEITTLNTQESDPEPVNNTVTIVESPQTATIALGSSHNLTAVIEASDAAVYQWEAKYGRNWEFITGAKGTTLNITNAQHQDDRYYRLGITAPNGKTTYSKAAYLYVLETPSIANQPQDMSFLVDRGGVILVPAEGSTNGITWEWYKDGTSIGISTNGKWLIPSTANQVEHGGTYQVKVANIVGEVTSDPFNVSIVETFEIIQQPVDTAIGNGESGSLSVIAEGGGEIRYQWKHYNPYTRVFTPVEGATEATWTISSMNESLAGIYMCTITNGAVTLDTLRVYLTMHVVPQFTAHPQDIETVEGTTVVLDSHAIGDPAPSYQWQKFNEENEAWENLSRIVLPSYELKVVTPETTGRYRVAASNIGGTTYSDEAIVTVYYKPIITENIAKTSANKGSDVTFTIGAHGLDQNGSELMYQWYFNGELMTDSELVLGSTDASLFLQAITTENNYGVYHCVVSNAIGETLSYNAVLDVIEPPVAYTTLEDILLNEEICQKVVDEV